MDLSDASVSKEGHLHPAVKQLIRAGQREADVGFDAAVKLSIRGPDVTRFILRARTTIVRGVSETTADDRAETDGTDEVLAARSDPCRLECRRIRDAETTEERVNVPPSELVGRGLMGRDVEIDAVKIARDRDVLDTAV